MKPRLLLAAAAGLAVCATAVRAQQPSAQPDTTTCTAPAPQWAAGATRVEDDFGRLLEISGVRPLRSGVLRRGLTRPPMRCGGAADPLGSAWYRPDRGAGDGVELVEVSAHGVFNSSYPRAANDGALWAGRGASAVAAAAAAFQFGPLTGALAPLLLYQQNRAFDRPRAEVPGLSEFAYPWHRGFIDLPLRHGDDPVTRLDAGQSFLRVDAYGLAVGVSNENVWWGPALHNPLVLGAAAPGFPHLFLRTSGPIDIRIGRLEAELLWGRLRESDFYDFDPDNDDRLLAGLAIAFEPRGLDGLFIGGTRTFMTTIPAEGFSIADYLLDPYRGVTDNPQTGRTGDNQIISLFLRWALPESGFEAYAEWARDDHWQDLEDLAKEPDHSQVYTLGLQKVTRFDSRWLRLYGELTHLQGALPFRSGRPLVTFYTNGFVTQGHTHRGQVLGAAIGPGSDAQVLGADLLSSRGRSGLQLRRARFDDDAYYAVFGRFFGQNGHDVELSATLDHHILLPGLEVGGALTYSHRYNRHFTGLESGNFDSLFSEDNVTVRVRAAWRPAIFLLR